MVSKKLKLKELSFKREQEATSTELPYSQFSKIFNNTKIGIKIEPTKQFLKKISKN